MTNAEKLAQDTETLRDIILGDYLPCYACIYDEDRKKCHSHLCSTSIKKWLESEAEETNKKGR